MKEKIPTAIINPNNGSNTLISVLADIKFTLVLESKTPLPVRRGIANITVARIVKPPTIATIIGVTVLLNFLSPHRLKQQLKSRWLFPRYRIGRH